MRFTAYSVRVRSGGRADRMALETRFDEIVKACKAQRIKHIGVLASITGKLLAEPEEFRHYRDRLSAEGITCWAEVFGVGHPAMGRYYNPDGTPPDPFLHWDGDLVARLGDDVSLLPRGWKYAVNEFGRPVYATAQLDEAWRKGNERVVRALATVFDEIWYDDEYRLDGDQNAGEPHTSTAADYSEEAMAELSAHVGRAVVREDVLADQALHDVWIDLKTNRLARMWQAVCEAARSVNPGVRMDALLLDIRSALRAENQDTH